MQQFLVPSSDDTDYNNVEATARVQSQDNALADIVADIFNSLGDRLDKQELDLSTIYKPMVRSAGDDIAAQQAALNHISNDLLTNVRSRLSEQSVMMEQLREFDVGTDTPTPQIPPTPGDVPPLVPPVDYGTPVPPPGIPPNTCGPNQTPQWRQKGDGTWELYCVDMPGGGIPPGTPPPVPPPGQICDVDPCYPTPSVVIGRRRIRPPQLPTRYWYVFCCISKCESDVTVYRGNCRPEEPPGCVVDGPYDLPLTDEQIYDKVRHYCGEIVPVPPVPPGPPVPPPGPPVPPSGPPVPPSGPPVPPPVTLPGHCERLDFDHPELCKSIDLLVKAFTELGESIRKEIFAVGDGVVEALDLVSKLQETPIVGKLFSPASQFAFQLKFLLKGILLGLRSPEMACVTGQTNTLLALWLAKTLVTSLENIVGGWELGPQILVTIKFDLHQIKVVLDYVINYVAPVNLLQPDEIRSAYLSNQITQANAECMLRMHGFGWKQQQKLIHAQRQRPDRIEIISESMRKGLPLDVVTARLRESGWTDDKDIQTALLQTEQLPTPSDAIRFAVKDAYDITKLGRAEMKDELDDNKGLIQLFNALGIRELTTTDTNGTSIKHDIPLFHWLSSYAEISPTQSYEMLHRLRPGRLSQYRMNVTPTDGQKQRGTIAGSKVISRNGDGTWTIEPDVVTFTDVQRLLKEVDYNPIWRSRLAAISYHTIGRVDLRRFYALGIFGKPLGVSGFVLRDGVAVTANGVAEKEIYERFQDMGYNATDAMYNAHFTAAHWQKTKDGSGNNTRIRQTCEAWREGVIDRQTANDRLEQITGSKDTAKQQLDNCETATKLKTVKATVNAIRRLYMRAETDETDTRRLLTKSGVLSSRQDELIQLWTIQRAGNSKQMAASVMCQWYQNGLISLGEIHIRLTRYGYTKADADNIVKHCQMGFAAKTVAERNRRIKAIEQENDKARRYADKLQKIADDKAADAKATFLKGRTDANLKAWFAAGQITREEIYATLLLRGMPHSDAMKWVNTYLKGSAPDEK